MGNPSCCPRCGRTPQSCVCKQPYSTFMNYIGDDKDVNVKPTRNENLVSQTNTFLLASAFLLGVAIISRK